MRVGVEAMVSAVAEQPKPHPGQTAPVPDGQGVAQVAEERVTRSILGHTGVQASRGAVAGRNGLPPGLLDEHIEELLVPADPPRDMVYPACLLASVALQTEEGRVALG